MDGQGGQAGSAQCLKSLLERLRSPELTLLEAKQLRTLLVQVLSEEGLAPSCPNTNSAPFLSA
jgi:hypothetical protein